MFDGVRAHTGQVLAVIRHNARVLLSCERVILNLLQHLSGIATLTRKYADAIQGTQARVLDTRKTVPGMRALEKYAVLCGGGTNHRIDLASGILIKNNHISLGGGIAAVLKRALEQRKPGQRVQVEVRNAAGARRSAAHGAEAILLDNMTPAEVKRSIERIKVESAEERWIPTEASGGIVLDNIRAYAETGVDFISVGALTHSARAADISMTITAEPGEEERDQSRLSRRGALASRPQGSPTQPPRPRTRARISCSISLLSNPNSPARSSPASCTFPATTGSTNSDALGGCTQMRRAARLGVLADEQLAGRGRGDHGWISAAGEGPLRQRSSAAADSCRSLALLPLAAGLAAADAIRAVSGLSCRPPLAQRSA